MKTVQIKMPDEIHDMIKIKAVKDKTKMKDLMVKLLIKGLGDGSKSTN